MYDSGDSTPHDATASPAARDPDSSVPGLPNESPAPPLATDASDDALSADQVKLALRRVKDPELNLNIIDLGLIYDIRVDGNDVHIDMSLTSPGCPSGPEIMGDAEKQLQGIPGVGVVAVNLVWSPPWTPERIEPRVRAYMGF